MKQGAMTWNGEESWMWLTEVKEIREVAVVLIYPDKKRHSFLAAMKLGGKSARALYSTRIEPDAFLFSL